MKIADLKEHTFYTDGICFYYIVSKSGRLMYEYCNGIDKEWWGAENSYTTGQVCPLFPFTRDVNKLIAQYGAPPSYRPSTDSLQPPTQKTIIPENKNSKICVNCSRDNKEVVLFQFSTYYCPVCEP